MVPIDYNGFGASSTPNPDCSRETWKRLYAQGELEKSCGKVLQNLLVGDYIPNVTHQTTSNVSVIKLHHCTRDTKITAFVSRFENQTVSLGDTAISLHILQLPLGGGGCSG